MASTYLGRSIEGSVGIGRQTLRAHGQSVRDLEERSDAEGLGQVGAKAGKGQVVEEDIALDFLGDVVDGAGVAQA